MTPVPRENVRQVVHTILEIVKGFNHVHVQPRPYEERTYASSKFATVKWKDATLFIDGTHIRLKNRGWMKKGQWAGQSFFSYKLKENAVTVMVYFSILNLNLFILLIFNTKRWQ